MLITITKSDLRLEENLAEDGFHGVNDYKQVDDFRPMDDYDLQEIILNCSTYLNHDSV